MFPARYVAANGITEKTLEVRYKGKNIYEVLEMTVEEALAFFSPIPKIARKLQTLYDVGLGVCQTRATFHTAFGR